MSQDFDHPLNHILRELLIKLGVGIARDGTYTSWQIFHPNVPDDPGDVIVIKKTADVSQGGVMVSGEERARRGLQILVRGDDYTTTEQKARKIAYKLNTEVVRTSATIGSDTYNVWSARATGPIELGREGTENGNIVSNREMFSINVLMVLEKIT